MLFIDLFNTMKCDFFELQTTKGTKTIDFDLSKDLNLQEFYNIPVIDFYPIRAKNNNNLGLLIRLEK